MYRFKVLLEGYAKETDGGWLASSTVSLIKGESFNLLVDPGANKALLIEALSREGLELDDINIVFMTHYHPDHILNVSVFDKAKVMDGETIYENDKEISFEGDLPGTSIQVLKTPGHAYEHSTLLVETNQGKVAVCSDLFWWFDSEKQETDNYEKLINREDPFVKDFESLKRSRKLVLKKADWIIPGHGKMFKNPLRK